MRWICLICSGVPPLVACLDLILDSRLYSNDIFNFINSFKGFWGFGDFCQQYSNNYQLLQELFPNPHVILKLKLLLEFVLQDLLVMKNFLSQQKLNS